LRAVAVFGVLVEHFCPSHRIVDLSPGGAGVTLFFVLSGYLITSILLKYQIRGVDVKTASIHFYTRRLLRLSPPYYLAIAIGVLFGLAGLRSTNWWIPALYLTNFNVAYHGSWHGPADHFWSLAVEEQFYILWFLVVVKLPRQYFVSTVAVTMGLTVAFRMLVYLLGLSTVTTVVLPGHIATLATGGLIAYWEQQHSFAERVFMSTKLLILSGFVFTAVSISLPYLTFPRLILYPFSGMLFWDA
jgi:peptidoglycan/LPS O-acetylase OafA/YrhL